MIEWRKVTKAEPKPDHDGQILFYKRHSGLNIGRRGASGAFYFPEGYYTDVDFWTPLNMPVEDGDETIDGKEDRVSALEAAHARLVERVTALEYARKATVATGWAVIDENKDPYTRSEGFISRMAITHHDVLWFITREPAVALAAALGSDTRAVLLDKETLEEVDAR